MINYARKAGTVDVSVVIRIIDSTDGTPETGVVYNTAGIDLQYRREGTVSVEITEATLAALTTAHTDGGFLHIGNGYYRLDLPDAACAAGAVGVLIHGVVTGMVVIGCYIQLVTYDPFDSVRLGLTSLPNAAADAAGGLPISDAGGLDIDTKLANTNEVTAARMGALTDLIDGGRLDLLIDAIKACTDLVTAARMGALTDLIDGGRLDLLIDAIKAQTDLVTAARMGALTDLIDGGRLDLILDIIAADTTTDIPALIALLQTAVDNNSLAIAAIDGTIGTNGDGLTDIPKTGFKLASDGMDLVACDVAVVGATPTLLINKIQAIWNRLFTKKTVTATLETAYEKDDTTTMETWDLADDDTTASRTR